MTRALVNVRLADDVTAALDAVAAARGLTRSDAVREAIDAYLAPAIAAAEIAADVARIRSSANH